MSGTITTPLIRSKSIVGLSLLLTSWLVTRGVILAQTLDGDVPLDIVAYLKWAKMLGDGGSPASDTAYVYPPGSNVIFLLTNFFGPGASYRAFTIVAATLDLMILLGLSLASRRQPRSRLLAPWAWVIMGFASGPLLYERYDIAAAVFCCFAVISISRPMLSGGLSGIGFLIKLWPEIAILGLPRSQILKGLAVNLLAIVIGWTTLEVFFGDSLGFLRNVLNKGLSVEAVAAYPFLLLRALTGSHGVTGQYGSWEVIGPWVSVTALLTTILGIVLIASLLLLRVLGRLELASPGDVVLLGVLVFVASHKINSLQYGVWIAAMTAAALVFTSSKALGPAILLTLSLFVANEVIWTHFIEFISGNPILIGFQGLRLLLLLSATAWLAALTLRSQPVDVVRSSKFSAVPPHRPSSEA